ncbi:hypothetical protein DF211_18360 [Pectobacterium parmentieri]|nr:hypothetical protein DF211_18360 [Pectobacterium parmentieri]
MIIPIEIPCQKNQTVSIKTITMITFQLVKSLLNIVYQQKNSMKKAAINAALVLDVKLTI